MDLGILNRFLVLLVYCSLPQICAQLCRTPCFCSWIQPRCPPGVPIIVDGCGCCRICARQLGESCDRLYLCDESKELLCDYATGSNGRGTCNYNYDGGCEYNGKEYKDEEVFQPSCKFQCKCMDGGVTCTPLCSENVLLATPECPSPRRVEVPGRCCSEWICDEEQQSPVSNSLEKDPLYHREGRRLSRSLAQNGAPNGAHVPSAAGWACPCGCQTGIPSAGWRPKSDCVW
ncbi:hypothetical protein XELAEV_18046135mg [Xenopus laevis]|uniref:WNT1-inducible-signaling pathway protein 2 n=1 Tax=Xenopus laevis TaxID=8355 RepID=A0A974BSR3_XENLA|nr:hypothetical protein XELAEV_18046135mg [Xenopus laevis]